jgi:hypothetical protein
MYMQLRQTVSEQRAHNTYISSASLLWGLRFASRRSIEFLDRIFTVLAIDDPYLMRFPPLDQKVYVERVLADRDVLTLIGCGS